MTPQTTPRGLLLALLACAISGAGCAVPFGRSYLIQRQQIDVSYRPASRERVSVHARYRLRNAGLPAIESLEIQLPDPANFNVQNVRAQWLGHPAAGKPIADSKDQFHFEFGGSLKTKASGDFDLRYDLEIPTPANGQNSSALFLPSFGWYPRLLAAEGPLGSGGAWPVKWELDVTVPENYSVHASGRESGRKRQNGEMQWRFLQTARDYLPFAVAGNYSSREIRSGSTSVELWSVAPVNDTRAKMLADRLAADDRFFAEQFGTSAKEASKLWVIECASQSGASSERPWLATSGCMTVPDAAVVPAGFLSGVGADTESAALRSIDMQLAASRFYFVARVDRNGPLYPLAAADDYAVFALEASRSAGSRDSAVRDLLARLAQTPPADSARNLTAITREDSAEVREAAHLRSELFYIALEDRCGARNIRHALARIFRVMQGGAWSLNELRSAAEGECNLDLADFFREWLDHPGIPEEFRARYLSPSAVPR